MTRTFYENIINPGEADPDSEHDEPTVPMPNQGDISMEAGGERDGTRGISEIGDSESVAVKRQRKGYVRDGPTVYKLVKPVMKAIKEAHSLEYVYTSCW